MSLEGDNQDDFCDGDCDYCEYDDACHGDSDEEFEEEDSGFIGSMLEAQLIRDGQKICPICGMKISSVLDEKNPNPCKEEVHASFKRLFEVRCQIGLHDLRTRGYD